MGARLVVVSFRGQVSHAGARGSRVEEERRRERSCLAGAGGGYRESAQRCLRPGSKCGVSKVGLPHDLRAGRGDCRWSPRGRIGGSVPSGGGQAALSALRSVVRVSRERVGGVLSERWGRRGVVVVLVVLVGAREKRKFFFIYWVCVDEVGIVGGMRCVVGAVKEGCLFSRSSL